MTKNITIDYMIENGEKFARKCSHCNKPTNEVYIVNDGDEYYCSDDCLHEHYTPIQWARMYKNEVGYWTSFDDGGEVDDDEVQYIKFGDQLIEL